MMVRKTLATNETLVIPAGVGPTVSIALLSGQVNLAFGRVPTTADPVLNDRITEVTLDMSTPQRNKQTIQLKATTASDVQWMVV
jgi:hypothetical protein